MLGLTVEDVGRIRKMGYHLVEENELLTQIINPQGETVAKISVDEKALLSISIGEEKLENAEWISIKTPFLPQKIIFEIKIINSEFQRTWAALPLKEKEPVFWSSKF